MIRESASFESWSSILYCLGKQYGKPITSKLLQFWARHLIMTFCGFTGPNLLFVASKQTVVTCVTNSLDLTLIPNKKCTKHTGQQSVISLEIDSSLTLQTQRSFKRPSIYAWLIKQSSNVSVHYGIWPTKTKIKLESNGTSLAILQLFLMTIYIVLKTRDNSPSFHQKVRLCCKTSQTPSSALYAWLIRLNVKHLSVRPYVRISIRILPLTHVYVCFVFDRITKMKPFKSFS